MTIKQLIDKLKQYNPNMEILIDNDIEEGLFKLSTNCLSKDSCKVSPETGYFWTIDDFYGMGEHFEKKGFKDYLIVSIH